MRPPVTGHKLGVPPGAYPRRMDVRCPERNGVLELLTGDEMGSAPRRYVCESCCIWYERDASGLLVEVDE